MPSNVLPSEPEVSKAVDDILYAIQYGQEKHLEKLNSGLAVVAKLPMNEGQRKALRKHPIEILDELNLLKTPLQNELGSRILAVHLVLEHCIRDNFKRFKADGLGNEVRIFLSAFRKSSLNKMEKALSEQLHEVYIVFKCDTREKMRYYFTNYYPKANEINYQRLKERLQAIKPEHAKIASRRTPKRKTDSQQKNRRNPINPNLQRRRFL